jgi:hypothetical protein
VLDFRCFEGEECFDRFIKGVETPELAEKANQLREKLSLAQAFYRCNRRPYFRTMDSYRRSYRRRDRNAREFMDSTRTLSASQSQVMSNGQQQDSAEKRYDADGHERSCRLGSGMHSSHPLVLCSACPAVYHAPSCLGFETSVSAFDQGVLDMRWLFETNAEVPPQFWFCTLCRWQRLPAWLMHVPLKAREKEAGLAGCRERALHPASILDRLTSYCRQVLPPRCFTGPRFVVLSLFDGIASARHALALLGVPATLVRYYACEIDQDALAVVQSLYPDVRQLGPVEGLASFDDLPETVDLLIGGSPCTSLSGLGKRKGLFDGASALFFEFLRIKRAMKPRFYLFENVSSMRASDKRRIHRLLSEANVSTSGSMRLGAARDCCLVELDAARVTASLRRRLYVANFSLPPTTAALPDWGLRLQDVLDPDGSVAESSKAFCITTNNMQGRPGDSRFNVVAMPAEGIRRGLRIHEVEKCLGFPADYTAVLASRPTAAVPRRWRLLGNAFAPPMIALLIWPLLEHSPVGTCLGRTKALAQLELACRQQALGDCRQTPVTVEIEARRMVGEHDCN